MKKTILEIYARAVRFFAVACRVVAAGIAVYVGVQITWPEFTVSGYQYQQFQSNEAFRKVPGAQR